MRRILIVLVLAGSLAACGSSKVSSDPNATSAPAETTQPVDGAPKLYVVLDDSGVTFPPGKTPAGTYQISFEDRRTAPPAGQKLHLQFIVSGPQLLLFDIPAGTSSTHALRANMTPEIVYLDPGVVPTAGSMRPADMAHRHPIDVPVRNPLEIEATPELPTPVT